MEREFGKQLEKARTDRNMRREDAAEILQCSASSLFRYEKGTQIPSRRIYDRICDVFNISLLPYDRMFIRDENDTMCNLLEEIRLCMHRHRMETVEEYLIICKKIMESHEVDCAVRQEAEILRLVYFYQCFNTPLGIKERLDDILKEMWKNAESREEYFRNSIQNSEELSRRELIGYNLYAVILMEEGRYEEADLIFSVLRYQMDHITTEMYGESRLRLLGNISLCKMEQKQYRAALNLIDRTKSHIFPYGGVELELFAEIIRASCFLQMNRRDEFSKELLFVKKLMEIIPPELNENKTAEELVCGKKRGMQIYGD